MASLYRYGTNPFRDFLLDSLLIDIDISTKKTKKDIDTAFKYILENVLINNNEIVYLDFEIIKEGEYYKVHGKNSVSALWLSGFFPSDASIIVKSNTFIIGNKKYVFDKKTNELTCTIIHN
jgi:hypothetical protein